MVGPKQHAPSAVNCTDGSDDCRDFSSRNPYATVRGMVKDANTASGSSIGRSGSTGSNGDIILGWVNSTKSSTCINFQNVLTVNAATGEWEVGEAMRVDMGKIEGVLAGPVPPPPLSTPPNHQQIVVFLFFFGRGWEVTWGHWKGAIHQHERAVLSRVVSKLPHLC